MEINSQIKLKWWKRRWFKIVAVVMAVFVVGGVIFLWKAGSTINKITTGGLFQNITSVVPGIKDGLKGESDGRINILILGMRGENVPGGGLLADTIMVVSLKLDKNQPQNNKVSMISIPRDLYVDNPVGEIKLR
jgi:anionic cell wall polymer biosynthesis LytR-Cps2A-Psr (LCP) family protein